MAEPVTQGQFFERMQQSDDKFQEAHRRLRELMEDGIRDIKAEMAAHAKDDATSFKGLGDRLLVIETERKSETNASAKRTAWLVIVIGALEALAHGVTRWWR